jgi:hypothetical protein
MSPLLIPMDSARERDLTKIISHDLKRGKQIVASIVQIDSASETRPGGSRYPDPKGASPRL